MLVPANVGFQEENSAPEGLERVRISSFWMAPTRATSGHPHDIATCRVSMYIVPSGECDQPAP
jgi:hypothetical protein